MTKIISFINLKGGVGKTSTAVAMAEALSSVWKQKVLVIDLDPQTNATLMLIGEEKWLELNRGGHTLAHLFGSAMNPGGRPFELDQALQKCVSDVLAAETIDLLPSSIDLVDFQDRIAMMPVGRFFAATPVEVLSQTVGPLLEGYDTVLIDCPPNLGIVTLNGLYISGGYIIPTIPDTLSTYGIPQIVSRVSEFSRNIGRDICPLGIVISKFQANSTVHNNIVRELRNNPNHPKVYQTIIKQSNSASAAVEYWPDKRTLRQKYGADPNGLATSFINLAREIRSEMGA